MTSTRKHKYIFSIWYACRHGRQERVEELYEREGGNKQNIIINAVDTAHNDLTPLHWAAKFGHEDLCKWLLLRGANPSAVAKDGNTPLHLAAGNSTIRIVRLLLEYASEPRMKNAKGDLPADVAKTYRRWDSEDLLRRWEPCGGFPDLRNSGFEFQRMTDHELRFTLPLPEPPPKPPRTLEWMTPTEATTEEERRKVRKEISRQKEALMLKKRALGEGVVTASVGISLLRIARLLRKLGDEGNDEALDILHRAMAIFERLHRKAQVTLYNKKKKKKEDDTTNNTYISDDEEEEKNKNSDNNNGNEGKSSNADDDDAIAYDNNGGKKQDNEDDNLIPIVNNNKTDKGGSDDDDEEENEAAMKMSFNNRKTIADQRADEYASVLQELSSLCVKNDMLDEAEKTARTASTVISTSVGENNMELAGALTNLGLILREKGKRYENENKHETFHKEKHDKHVADVKQEVMSIFIRALTIVENRVGPNHIDVAELLEHIANGYVMDHEHMKAAALLERKLEIVSIGTPQTEEHAKAYDELAQVYFSLKRYELSESLFQNALNIRETLHNTKMIPDRDDNDNKSPEVINNTNNNTNNVNTTIPIVEEEQDNNMMSNNDNNNISSSNRVRASEKFRKGKKKKKNHDDSDSEDESLTKIMRADIGTSVGQKLVETEEDKKRIPFSKGYRRPKKEDLVYEPVREIHPSIQRTYNNIAIVGGHKIKNDRRERRKYRQEIKKYKSKVNQARRIDDIRYLKERPAREKEGIYSASVGRKDSAISKTLDFHDNKDAKDDGIRNFEKPTAYHTAYDEVQRLKK